MTTDLGAVPWTAFAGTPTPSTFARGMWLTLFRPARNAGYLTLACFAAVLLTGGWQVIVRDPGDQLPRLAIGMAFVAVFLILPRFAIARQWSSSPALRAPVRGVASDAGLEWQHQDTTAQIPWSGFRSFAKQRDMYALQLSGGQWLFIPREYFVGATDWKAFAGLIERSVPRNAKRGV